MSARRPGHRSDAKVPRSWRRGDRRSQTIQPEQGSLAEIADPAVLAGVRGRAAAAISVLTEQRHFAGTLDDLVRVRCAVNIPVLRKDFVVTAYQLFEARAAGADLVLLIVAALSDSELVSLVERARSIGLTPLVEVHTADEVRRAVDAGATIIGVNARNLQTLKVEPSTFSRLAPLIPDGIRIAESGVRGPHDVIDLARAGADVVLVGEALVTGRDPRSGVADLVAAGAHPARARLAVSGHLTRAPQSKESSRVKAVRRDLGAAAAAAGSLPDASGHFDKFGGRFVPEALFAALLQLEREFHGDGRSRQGRAERAAGRLHRTAEPDH